MRSSLLEARVNKSAMLLFGSPEISVLGLPGSLGVFRPEVDPVNEHFSDTHPTIAALPFKFPPQFIVDFGYGIGCHVTSR
jgi:hypothetical protein